MQTRLPRWTPVAVIVVLMVVLVSLACSPKATATPTPAATATPTKAATPTQAATPTTAPGATATIAVATATPTNAPGATIAATPTPTKAATTAASPTPTTAPATTPAKKGKYGGTLRYGMAPNAENLFFVAYSGGAGSAWAFTVGDPLFAYGPNSEWLKEKSVAESYDLSADGLKLTVHLRKGVKFHDGTPMDAEAVKYSLQWTLDPKNSVTYAPAISAIDASKIEVVDANTVVLNMSRVFSPIITNLGMIPGMPFSPTAFKALGRDGFATKPSGTGPFRVKEWKPGSYILFEKFPEYWRAGAPYLDAWRWDEIPDGRVRAAALQTGELDVAEIEPSALDSVATARKIPGIQEFKGFGGPRMDHYNAARAPFNDIRVRQAATMAIDRFGWNKVMTGNEGYIYRGCLLPEGHPACYEVPEKDYPWQYNPTKARQLLEEYAKEKGLTLPIDTLEPFTCTADQKAKGCVDLPAQPITIVATGTRADLQRAELSKAYYEGVGFKVELQLGMGNESKKSFATKEIGFSLRGYGLRPHPSGTFDSYLGYGGELNAGGWNTSPEQMEMDRLVKEAGKTFDIAKQNQLYQQAQKIYMENLLGGVKIASEPTFHFLQSWVKWEQQPDKKWVKYLSDNALHIHELWIDK